MPPQANRFQWGWASFEGETLGCDCEAKLLPKNGRNKTHPALLRSQWQPKLNVVRYRFILLAVHVHYHETLIEVATNALRNAWDEHLRGLGPGA